MSLILSWALFPLVLAAIGIYGVLSYSVAQRKREIGVRIAVGAGRADILGLVLREAGSFTALGVAAGLAAGLACARLINGILFQTSTVDRVSMGFAVGVLLLVAALGASLPAIRAASVNPTEALRTE